MGDFMICTLIMIISDTILGYDMLNKRGNVFLALRDIVIKLCSKDQYNLILMKLLCHKMVTFSYS